MIKCIINGTTVYPDDTNSIKVTYANQYIEDSGEYTLQVSFPMSILDNKVFFKNVDRLVARKNLPDYEDCKLIVDNRVIISGKGTVQNITNEAVKLQIVGGKTRIKYNAKMANHFIDEIDYPAVNVNIEQAVFNFLTRVIKFDFLRVNLSNTCVVGEKGKYAFNPVYDETNDIIANNILVNSGKAYMYDIAVQPYLFHVLECVLRYEGFTIGRNDYDVDPWNRLVICNATKGTDIKHALPHWSVYTFIEEIRKLFNASFVFNESTKTVDIIASNEMTANDTVKYECLDEFTTDYEEEGLKNVATSNLRYDFAESANRDYRDVMPLQVLKKFPVREFDNSSDAMAAARQMTQKERMTTIFKTPLDYIIFTIEDDQETATGCGYFSPLIRDEQSDEYIDLKIHPVAMTYMNRWREGDNELLRLIDEQGNDLKICVPSITNDRESDLNSLTIDTESDGEYYISVQDAMQDTNVIETEEEDENEKLQIMFQGDVVYNYREHTTEYPERDGAGDYQLFRYPTNLTDYRIYFWLHNIRDYSSLSLHSLPFTETIGGYASTAKINRHSLITISFITEEIPDPSKIFLFNSKRYLCQKVELEIKNGEIDRVKKGYFYELLDD